MYDKNIKSFNGTKWEFQSVDDETRIFFNESVNVLKHVCNISGVSMDEITSPSRKRMIVTARCLAAFRLRRHGLRFSEIGLMLRRDHSSIMHEINAYYQMKDSKDPILMNMLNKEQK